MVPVFIVDGDDRRDPLAVGRRIIVSCSAFEREQESRPPPRAVGGFFSGAACILLAAACQRGYNVADGEMLQLT